MKEVLKMSSISNNRKKYTLAAMFAALICIATAFIHISSPTGGIIHVGDAFIYLAACFLPAPLAIASASIGAGFADLLVYPETIIYTIIIKGINAIFFTHKGKKILTKRNALMTLPSGAVTIIGYSISKAIRVLLAGGTTEAAISNAILKIPENSVQAIASGIIFIILAKALDKANLKEKLSSM